MPNQLCDNAFYGIMLPQCDRGQATKEMRIIYSWAAHEAGYDDSDTLLLCDECASLIKKDAEAHSYKVEISDWEDKDEGSAH